MAEKALRVNLSDLASMAAEPVGYLLSLALPKHDFDRENWVKEFSTGLQENQSRFNWRLWGGDTVSTTGPITISVTAIGLVEQGKVISRSTAKSGDSIYVSGTLGDAAGGLEVIRQDLNADKYQYLVDRYYVPQPRLELANALSELVTSMMDISDGLLGDLGHICENSSVGADVFSQKIPLSASFGNLLETKGQYSHLPWSGGDDYELLFTLSQEDDDQMLALSKKLNVKLTKIGKITDGQNIRLLDGDGAEIDSKSKGYSHF